METENSKLEDTYSALLINADTDEERAALDEDMDRLREAVSGMYVDLTNRWIIRTASVLKGEG